MGSTLLALVSLLVVAAHSDEVYVKPKEAFIFGGNGQIGAAVVQMLLKQNYQITTLNRGSDYYNSRNTKSPKVTVLECDRFKGLKKQCPAFMEYLAANAHVDVVVDLNAFTTRYMKESADLFKTINVGVYLFISPDNVYDVSIKRHHGPTKETDTERPVDKEEYETYADVDRFGHYKLLAEEYLASSGLNYLIFRAPDVIGARDTSSKFWIYHMWVKYYETLNTPIHMPYEIKELVSSYVYLDDVVQAFKKGIESEVRNETFNIAFKEPVTLTTLLLEISHVLESPIKFNHEVTTDNSYHLYPSSARGQLDISKAEFMLDFKPTKLTSAVKKTVNYYERAQKLFDSERRKVMEELSNNIATDQTRVKFMSMVMAEALSGRRDEL
ncbi:uncharacterized protein LOC134824701 [Bolinopsis microptera]|uniref:uncharacterized protein LOC134824701 n=1 Tax=Bolinopsis microptera TaxID=2820187 RepID=UPI003079BF5C